MNQKNVDALHALLVEAYQQEYGAAEVAQYLASRGVLVASVPTDDEFADVVGLSDDGRGFAFPQVLRECLENLAKGKPLPAKGYHQMSPTEIKEFVEQAMLGKP